MSFTNFLENKVLAYVFTGTAYSSPSASLYLALFTTDPGEGGSGTEVSGTNYARQLFSMTTSTNTSTNGSAIEFPAAGSSWGTVTHVAVMDALTSGNMLASAALTASKTIGSGDVFRIPAGDLDITLD
jgi:hypothetical protein